MAKTTETQKPFKIDLKAILTKVTSFFKHTIKVIVIIVAMATGFAASQIYNKYNRHLEQTSLPKTKTHIETSIAINEAGEIIIMDRSNGTYAIYSDSVGKMFFDLYASQLMYKVTKPQQQPPITK